MHPTKIIISQHQLRLNLQAIRRQIGPAVKFCLPVKANAYGHGLLEVSLFAEPYVDYLAVACLDEGRLLRQNGIRLPILVFGAIDEEQIPGLVQNDLEITISSLYKANLVAQFCQPLGKCAKIHLKVDTGMNRVGIRAENLLNLVEFVLANPFLDLRGLYSHFASSDELDSALTEQQLSIFKQVARDVKKLKPDVICHIANSGGVCYFPDSYLDMVRPGILSYGYFPASNNRLAALANIRPCFSLQTRVSYFKVIANGQGVSYNHSYQVANQATRIITLPIGYGDGYRRGLSNQAEVIVRGHKYRVCGNICMDMLMVDIGPAGEAYVGDEVVLIGKQQEQEILITELAAKLDTIVYEILVGFNQRIPRVFSLE